MSTTASPRRRSRWRTACDGGRAQLSADARRYDLLVVNGWLVLRFSYEQVMTQPDCVRRVLVAAVALAERMREGLPITPAAA